MSADKWTQVQEATIFLKPFSDYTHAVSSGHNAIIYNRFFIYNDIFDHIEKQCKRIRTIARDKSWAPGLLAATKACRLVL